MDTFANWYNHDHRHAGIGLHTPADVHFGLAIDKAGDRRTVRTDAHIRHPHRFGTTHAPKILDLNRPGFRAHFFLREGWHDAEQVRREHQGQGGPVGP